MGGYSIGNRHLELEPRRDSSRALVGFGAAWVRKKRDYSGSLQTGWARLCHLVSVAFCRDLA